MREPQVERFCRCIKKVKKTFRSKNEGRAIAICTKSILQKRRRTIRKVRCRKHLLVTQPMKGGEMIAMGADTPVFYDKRFNSSTYLELTKPVQVPDPNKPGEYILETAPKSQEDIDDENTQLLEEYPVAMDISDSDLVELLRKYRPVVRVIPAYGNEIVIHRTLKKWCSDETGPYLDKYTQMHMNLWAGDRLFKVDTAKTKERISGPFADAFAEKAKSIPDWYGLPTRYQRSNIVDIKNLDQKVAAVKDILKTLIHVDGKFVHFDLHMGNAAVLVNGTAVLHDFGRSKLRDYVQVFADPSVTKPTYLNKQIFRNNITSITEDTDYTLLFGQYFYLARYFYTEYDKIIEAFDGDFDEWLNVSSYNPDEQFQSKIKDRNPQLIKQAPLRVNLYSMEDPNVDFSDKNVEVTTRWTGEGRYFMEPMYETRYHQLARIFDILSVLKPLHDYTSAGKDTSPASKAALDLITALHKTPPEASPEYVRKTLLEYGLIDQNTVEDDNKKAVEYFKTIDDPRRKKGGGEPDPHIKTTGSVTNQWNTADGGPELPAKSYEPKPTKAGRRSFKKKLPRLV